MAKRKKKYKGKRKNNNNKKNNKKQAPEPPKASNIGRLVVGTVAGLTLLIWGIAEYKGLGPVTYLTRPQQEHSSGPVAGQKKLDQEAVLLKEFSDYFAAGNAIPYLQIPQDVESIRAALRLEAKNPTPEQKKKAYAELGDIMGALYNKSEGYSPLKLKDWLETRLEEGREESIHIYQAGDDYMLVKALHCNALHEKSLEKLLNKKASPSDLEAVRLFIENDEMQLGEFAYNYFLQTADLLYNDPSEVSETRKEQMDLFLRERMKHHGNFIHPITSTHTTKRGITKKFEYIGTFHNHNGSGHESWGDLETAINYPTLVIEYRPEDNKIETRILTKGTYKSSVIIDGKENFPELFRSSNLNTHTIAYKVNDMTHYGTTALVDLEFYSPVGLHSVSMFEGNVFREIVPMEGNVQFRLRKQTDYVPTQFIVVDSVGVGLGMNANP
ncbi:hypothetical protein ACFL6I_13925 [candidate division KSB1 bacterium]